MLKPKQKKLSFKERPTRFDRLSPEESAKKWVAMRPVYIRYLLICVSVALICFGITPSDPVAQSQIKHFSMQYFALLGLQIGGLFSVMFIALLGMSYYFGRTPKTA